MTQQISRSLVLGFVVSLAACEDSFMRQATADKTAAIATLATTLDESGNAVASIDPTSASTQLMKVTSGAVSGAAVAIPPMALSIPVSITVGEGVALASNSFSRDLGLTDNKISAGGPSVSFTASQDVTATNPMTLSIPFGALSLALADVDTENLVVMYRWMNVVNGEPSYEVGVLPGDKVTRGKGKVSFQTTKFGTFQVGLAETKISKPLLATTEEPPALKSCERYAAAVYPPCTADGQVGCVTTDAFKAADMSATKSEFILDGKQIASVTGNVTLPDAAKVLKDVKYGVAGTDKTGALTLPDAANVLASSSPYGDASSLITPALPNKGVWDLRASFGGAGYYSDFSNAPAAAAIASNTTVVGVPGTAKLESHSDCTADGATGCVAISAYPAALAAGAASKILNGQTLAGVAGNVKLPATGKVYTGVTYGVGGSGSTGTLTLPAAGYVLSTAPTYGDPGAPVTPALPSKGSWDLSTSFPGAGYYSGTSTPPPATNYAGLLFGVQGTASNESHVACDAEGKTGCVVVGPTYAAAITSNAESKIISGQSMAGVSGNVTIPDASKVLLGTTYGVSGTGITGTLNLPPACNGNNMVGCVTTNTFKSADLANLKDENIKNGVVIAGTTGLYPSTTYPLAGASSSIDDLSGDQTTAQQQLRSSTAFEFFKSDGTRVQASGDPNIVPTNIKNNVTILGTTGYYMGDVVKPWDVRVGVMVNGVLGKLKTTCRNRVSATGTSTIFNYDGLIGSIGTAASISGTSIDIWDTIDDYNNTATYLNPSLPPNIVTAWKNNPGDAFSNTDCGLETGAYDSSVWVDSTTDANGAASNCTTNPGRCTMMDRITSLWWSKPQTSTTWNYAWNICSTLNYNNQTGWRLPTQKELMEAYVHGVRSASNVNWISDTQMTNSYWSGTTKSNATSSAWITHLALGTTQEYVKTSLAPFVCVKNASGL